MARFLWLLAVMVGATLPFADARAGERMVDLFRNGYQIVHTEPYLSFEGCQYDKVYKLGPFIFICRTYEYTYRYGQVEIMARVFEYGGQRIVSAYLCVGEDQCLQGDLRRL
jgi:hypothetical protein